MNTTAAPNSLARVPCELDFVRLGRLLDVDLVAAFAKVEQLYARADQILAQSVSQAQQTCGLNMWPCRKGCDLCCHDPVRLTPLEFLYAWRYAQTHLPPQLRQGMVYDGLWLYAQFRSRIESLCAQPSQDERDWRYACPFLAADGACQIHPARELAARLFGSTFQDSRAQGLYACRIVGRVAAGRTLRLANAQAQRQQLAVLPLTHMQQVYPYYFQLFFCQLADAGKSGHNAVATDR